MSATTKRPKVLVTGATGKTGGAVAAQLLADGWPVRAVVHQRDARSERLDGLGAETVVADLFDPDQLVGAMRGTSRAYYCPPWHPYMIQSAAAFAVAAREADLEAVVGMSQWLAGPSHPALMTRQHWLADRLFGQLPGVAYTAVNPGFFADMPYMALIRYAALLGVFPMPVDGESRNAPPSVDDIARVAVAVLTDPDRHAGKTYRPTGPQLLSVRDMVGIMGRVLGRRVRHVNVPMWLMLKAARADGFDPLLLSILPYYLNDHGSGAFAQNAPTDDVLEVTGRPPESFETITRRYASRPDVVPTVGNRLRALVRFLSLPLRPGWDPGQFERDQGFPMPPAPRFAMEDDRWRADHGRRTVAELVGTGAAG